MAHLICQNAVQAVVVQTNHPLQTLELILLELTANKDLGLHRNPLIDTIRDAIILGLALSSGSSCLLMPNVVLLIGPSIISCTAGMGPLCSAEQQQPEKDCQGMNQSG